MINTAKRHQARCHHGPSAKADLTSVEYTGGKLVFKLNIKNNRTNPFEISYDHFCVMVTLMWMARRLITLIKIISKLQLVTADLSDPQLPKNSNVECTITAKEVPALVPTDTVTLIYYPDHTYGEYSARWNLLVSDGEVTLPTSSAEIIVLLYLHSRPALPGGFFAPFSRHTAQVFGRIFSGSVSCAQCPLAVTIDT